MSDFYYGKTPFFSTFHYTSASSTLHLAVANDTNIFTVFTVGNVRMGILIIRLVGDGEVNSYILSNLDDSAKPTITSSGSGDIYIKNNATSYMRSFIFSQHAFTASTETT